MRESHVSHEAKLDLYEVRLMEGGALREQTARSEFRAKDRQSAPLCQRRGTARQRIHSSSKCQPISHIEQHSGDNVGPAVLIHKLPMYKPRVVAEEPSLSKKLKKPVNRTAANNNNNILASNTNSV